MTYLPARLGKLSTIPSLMSFLLDFVRTLDNVFLSSPCVSHEDTMTRSPLSET